MAAIGRSSMATFGHDAPSSSSEVFQDDTCSSMGSENSTEFGFVVVIKRNGSDGPSFPVMEDTKIGRGKDSHIRIQLQTVRGWKR